MSKKNNTWEGPGFYGQNYINQQLSKESEIRYCFRTDNDGHLYMINVEDIEEFDEWLTHDWDDWEGKEFCCIDGGVEMWCFITPELIKEYKKGIDE